MAHASGTRMTLKSIAMLAAVGAAAVTSGITLADTTSFGSLTATSASPTHRHKIRRAMPHPDPARGTAFGA